MPAAEIAQVPRAHLERRDPAADERKTVAFESDNERRDPDHFPSACPDSRHSFPDPGHDLFRQFVSVPPYMESFSAIFRICTPCTSEAPPRIAAATWTASVISARFDPFSSDARVYASMQ